MKIRGLTLIEILVVIVILVVLVGILFPVISNAKMNGKISASQQSLKSFWMSLELYRNDNDEKVEYGTTAEMGLPPAGRGFGAFLQSYTNDPRFTWDKHRDLVPCGIKVRNETIRGLIYFPNGISDWPRDIQIYKASNVILADKNCNASNVRIDCQYCEKRSIGITVSGQLRIRRNSEHHVYDQRFYQP